VNCDVAQAKTTKARDLPCCAPDCSQFDLLAKRNLEAMNRTILYLIIGALVVVAAVLGYQVYQDRQETAGIQINVGKSGISIEKK
jgi:hypothetical protein